MILSRRGLAFAAGLVGAGGGAAGAALGRWIAWRRAGARLRLEGQAFALDPHGRMRPLARVTGEARVGMEPDGDGWRAAYAETLRLVGEDGRSPLERFRNPFTGADALAEPITLRAAYRLDPAFAAGLERGPGVLEEPPHRFDAPHEGGSQLLAWRLGPGPADVAAQVTRTLPWPAWTAMTHPCGPLLVTGQIRTA